MNQVTLLTTADAAAYLKEHGIKCMGKSTLDRYRGKRQRKIGFTGPKWTQRGIRFYYWKTDLDDYILRGDDVWRQVAA